MLSAKKRGRLIVFEGPDDVGKTTLAAMLSEHLSNAGTHAQLLSFPGREPETISELIYRLYHDPAGLGVKDIQPITMQVMVTAAHIEVIEARVKPLISSGVDVILDRFWWSTWVYATQQGITETARDLMIHLELESWGDLTPNHLFLILRAEPLLPQPPKSPWPAIRKLYQQLYERQKDFVKITTLTNHGSVSEAFDQIVSTI